MKFSVQQDAIINFDGRHSIIMACPGSGKTTVLVARILRLLRAGVNPKRICVLMFGSSAQKDFLVKLKREAGDEFLELPDVRTFHSLCNHLCGLYAKMNLMPKFRLESSDKVMEFMALDAMKEARASLLNDDNKSYIQNEELNVDAFVSFIDMIKATLKAPADVFKIMKINENTSVFIEAFRLFEKKRNEEKVRFFSDLIYDLVVFLQENPEHQKVISNHKDFVLVDEYQDTNNCQAALLKIIAGERASVMVVGDVDQAIYEWRGGDPSIMLNDFQRDFNGTSLLPLAETFRYGTGVSSYANTLIKHNRERFDTECKSNASVGASHLHVIPSQDYGDQTVSIIKKHLEAGNKLSEIVVLVRMYSHAASIELSLIEEGIDYRISNGIEFLKSKEASILLSIMELSAGHFEKMSEEKRIEKIKNILKFPHIGLKSDILNKVATAMGKKKTGYFDDVKDLLPFSVKKFHVDKIMKRCLLLSRIERNHPSSRAYGTVIEGYIEHTELFEWITTSSIMEIDGDESIQRCEVFSSYIKKIQGSIEERIEKIKDMSSNKHKSNADGVLITSIHKSKGLEWKTVIIPNLVEESFPYFFQKQPPCMEAERRLFYVGITRCIENVYLLTTRPNRMPFNGGDGNKVSRFIRELGINQGLSERPKKEPHPSRNIHASPVMEFGSKKVAGY